MATLADAYEAYVTALEITDPDEEPLAYEEWVQEIEDGHRSPHQ